MAGFTALLGDLANTYVAGQSGQSGQTGQSGGAGMFGALLGGGASLQTSSEAKGGDVSSGGINFGTIGGGNQNTVALIAVGAGALLLGFLIGKL